MSANLTAHKGPVRPGQGSGEKGVLLGYIDVWKGRAIGPLNMRLEGWSGVHWGGREGWGEVGQGGAGVKGGAGWGGAGVKGGVGWS